jgi:DNA-binding response OmpR family regulator
LLGRVDSGLAPAGLSAIIARRSQYREEAMARSVLIVDDEPNIVLALEFLVKQAGYNVRVARDGEAALAAVAESPPDLILLDVMMPKRDGFDVCQTIRENPDWKSTRIIMLTARGRDIDREKGIALGADDYITKPFSTRDVVELVKKYLGPAE